MFVMLKLMSALTDLDSWRGTGLWACMWGSALTRLVDMGNSILILDGTF